MTSARYLAGIALVAVAVAPPVLAAVRVRRRLLPAWDGALARLAEAVVALALLLAVAQLLGTVGAYYAVPFALACAVAGGLLALAVGPGRGGPAAPPVPRPDRVALVLALLGAAAVVGQWGVDTVDALDRGMYGSDTLRYHGPVAARFIQEHSVVGLHFLIDDPVVTFHPFDAELLHSAGMLLLGSDFLSPFLNLGWLALALLAAWCVGRPTGHGPATLLAAALVLASPALVQTQPGTVDNDVCGLALVLSAAALLVNSGERVAGVALSGLAAGLALATKLTTAGIVAAMTLGVAVFSPRGTRRTLTLAWLAPLTAAGFFWYARNLFSVGNPLPWFELGPLPSPPQLQGERVSHYLTDLDIWQDVFFPGFHARFGSVWVAVFVLALAGIALAALPRTPRAHRVIALAAAAGAVAYVVTPGTAAGPEGFPIFFDATARYIAPALALGAVLVPVAPLLAGPGRTWWFSAALAVLLVATLSNQGVEPLDASRAGFAAACLALLALLAAVRLGGVRVSRAALAAGAAVALVLVAVAGWRVADGYFDDRYADGEFAWTRALSDTRVGLVGSMRQYHLYGTDLSNRVQYIGHRGPHGSYTAITTCGDWREALAEGHYRFVVITPRNELFGALSERKPRETTWTETVPGAVQIVRQPGQVSVFRLDRGVRRTC